MLPSLSSLRLAPGCAVGVAPMKQLALYQVLQAVVGGTTPEERARVRRFLQWLYAQPAFAEYVPDIHWWLSGFGPAGGSLPSAFAELGWRKKRRLEGTAGDSTVRSATAELALDSDFLQGPWQVTFHLHPPSAGGPHSTTSHYSLAMNQHAADASFPAPPPDPAPLFPAARDVRESLEDYLTLAMLAQLVEWLIAPLGLPEALATLRRLWAQFEAAGG